VCSVVNMWLVWGLVVCLCFDVGSVCWVLRGCIFVVVVLVVLVFRCDLCLVFVG